MELPDGAYQGSDCFILVGGVQLIDWRDLLNFNDFGRLLSCLRSTGRLSLINEFTLYLLFSNLLKQDLVLLFKLCKLVQEHVLHLLDLRGQSCLHRDDILKRVLLATSCSLSGGLLLALTVLFIYV